MYSIVMLTALSAGADTTPAPPPHPAPGMVVPMAPMATGCCGGVVVTGCGGGCYGSSCHGCCGGGFLGMRSGGGLFGKHRTGCCGGGCYGSSCHGCSGGTWYGSCSGYSCFGSSAGCAGSVSYGSSWGPPIGMQPYTLHGYNSGAAQVWGPGFPVVPGHSYTDPIAVYGKVTNPNLPPVMTIPVAPVPMMTKPGSDTLPMGANLKFKVPAETKLYVDGQLTPGTGTERAFYTPALERGKKFFYDVKAEVVIGGKTVTEEKKVIVEAGANLTEEFSKLLAAVANPDTIAGK